MTLKNLQQVLAALKRAKTLTAARITVRTLERHLRGPTSSSALYHCVVSRACVRVQRVEAARFDVSNCSSVQEAAVALEAVPQGDMDARDCAAEMGKRLLISGAVKDADRVWHSKFPSADHSMANAGQPSPCTRPQHRSGKTIHNLNCVLHELLVQ